MSQLCAICKPADWENMNPFKDVFKDCECKLTPPQSRAHIFITQSLFNERLSVAGYKLPFREKNCGSKF